MGEYTPSKHQLIIGNNSSWQALDLPLRDDKAKSSLPLIEIDRFTNEFEDFHEMIHLLDMVNFLSIDNPTRAIIHSLHPGTKDKEVIYNNPDLTEIMRSYNAEDGTISVQSIAFNRYFDRFVNLILTRYTFIVYVINNSDFNKYINDFIINFRASFYNDRKVVEELKEILSHYSNARKMVLAIKHYNEEMEQKYSSRRNYR